MTVKSESEVAQLYLTLRKDPTDCSLPSSSVHGIFQARVLEWGAIAFSANALKYKTRGKSRVVLPQGSIKGRCLLIKCLSLAVSKESQASPALISFFHLVLSHQKLSSAH